MKFQQQSFSLFASRTLAWFNFRQFLLFEATYISGFNYIQIKYYLFLNI